MSEARDQAEILATLARYSTALDQRDWGLLEQVFTPDLVYDAGEWITHSFEDYLERPESRDQLRRQLPFIEQRLGPVKWKDALVALLVLTEDAENLRLVGDTYNTGTDRIRSFSDRYGRE